MLKLLSTFALRFSGHDLSHCHCRRHYLPSPETKRDRILGLSLFWGGVVVATGWALYHVVSWACDLPGTMRIH